MILKNLRQIRSNNLHLVFLTHALTLHICVSTYIKLMFIDLESPATVRATNVHGPQCITRPIIADLNLTINLYCTAY